jgi:hypothetical protein
MKTCLQYPRGPLQQQPRVLSPPPCRFDGSSRLFSPSLFRRGSRLARSSPFLPRRSKVQIHFSLPFMWQKKCTFYKRYNWLVLLTINSLDCCGKFLFLLYSDPFSSSLEGFPRFFHSPKFHGAVPATIQIGGLVWIIRKGGGVVMLPQSVRPSPPVTIHNRRGDCCS